MCDLYKLRTCRPCCIADHFIDNTMKWNEMKRMTRTTRRRANEWKRKKQQRIGWKIMWMGEAYKICAISRSIAHFWVIKLTHTNTYISFSPANNFTSRLSDYHLHIFLVIFIVRWCLGGFATCDKWGEKACTRETEKKSETSAFFLPYYEKKWAFISRLQMSKCTRFSLFLSQTSCIIPFMPMFEDTCFAYWSRVISVLFSPLRFFIFCLFISFSFSLSLLLLLLLLLYCSHAPHTMNVSVSSLRLFLLFSGNDVFQFQPKFRWIEQNHTPFRNESRKIYLLLYVHAYTYAYAIPCLRQSHCCYD